MTGSLTACISKYLESTSALRLWSANKFYWLLLLSSTPLLIGSSAVVSIAAPSKIAQAVPSATINRPTLKIGSQGERVSELQAALKLLGFYSGTVDGVYNENTANAVSQFKQAVNLKPDGIVDAATWQKLFPQALTTTSNNTSTQSSTSNTVKPEPTPVNRRTPPANSRTTTNRSTTATQVPTLAPEPRPVNRTTATTRPTTPARSSSTITFRQVPGIQYTSQGYPILRLGMSGRDVVTLQQQLRKFGFLNGAIDGDFGRTTEAAVKALQKRYGLEEDGVAGGATWDILLRRSPGQR